MGNSLCCYLVSCHILIMLSSYSFSFRNVTMICYGSYVDALYKELWFACAGPLVNVPREGERVYYFPQGHMEQVDGAFSF